MQAHGFPPDKNRPYCKRCANGVEYIYLESQKFCPSCDLSRDEAVNWSPPLPPPAKGFFGPVLKFLGLRS